MTESCARSPLLLFGGSFDPVHIGHLRMALELLACFETTGASATLAFVPARQQPHKQGGHATAEERCDMLEIAVDDLLAGIDAKVPPERGAGARPVSRMPTPAMRVEKLELQRPGPSYTVDTLRSLRAKDRLRPLCFIMGSDAWKTLPSWHEWLEIIQLAHIIVVRRPGHPCRESEPQGELLISHQTRHMEDLLCAPAGKVLFVELSRLDVSSTAIRQEIAAGRSPRYLVPDPVIQYIHAHCLYGVERSAAERADVCFACGRSHPEEELCKLKN